MIKSMATSTGSLTFSRRPSAPIFEALRETDLDIWWNLALELEDLVPRMRQCAAEVLSARITDFSIPADVPRFAEQLDHVVTLLRCGGRVHVNCHGGRGRTGLALACVLMLLEEMDPAAALAAAREASGGPETEEQSAFVIALHRSLRAES
jgi:protein-tyrosine phosphatase